MLTKDKIVNVSEVRHLSIFCTGKNTFGRQNDKSRFIKTLKSVAHNNNLMAFKAAFSGHGAVANYYWRDYVGVIPRDAVFGGQDASGRPTYIGQAYVQGEGFIPGVIHRGKKEMVVEVYGIKTCDLYLKILCSTEPKHCRWVRVTAENFHVEMIKRHPIKGGVERAYLLYIGRVYMQGEVIVGKIPASRPKPPLYVVSNNKTVELPSYEALVYMP